MVLSDRVVFGVVFSSWAKHYTVAFQHGIVQCIEVVDIWCWLSLLQERGVQHQCGLAAGAVSECLLLNVLWVSYAVVHWVVVWGMV